MDAIVQKINDLKKERNAVILVHNYQRPEVQDIADYLGDSLGLSQEAAATDADVILFCGVHFMAETAAILSPQKTVLIPDPSAGCPMAEMITVPELQKLKAAHPDATVVTYVNSTAAIKAESDVCCTSANALKVVQELDAKKIIFIPDQYLGQWVAKQTDKEFIFGRGYCPTHQRIFPEEIAALRDKYPGGKVLVHPECPPPVIAAADAAMSTEGMVRYVKETDAPAFIIGTEYDMVYRLKKEAPDKTIVPVSDKAGCPNMKKNSLEKVLWSLEEMQHVVTVPEEIADRARGAITRMLEFARMD